MGTAAMIGKLKPFLITKYRTMELGKRMLAILLSVSLFQIGIILVISYHLSSAIITEQTGELIDENMAQSAISIQSALERYDSIIQQIYTNTDYIEELKVINSWDGENYYLAKYSLENRLQDIIYENRGILGIAIVGRYGDICFYDGVTLSSQRSYCFDGGLEGSSLVQAAFGQKDSVYEPLMLREDKEYGSRTCFTIAHQLTDFNNYKRGSLGCVILCVDEAAFRRSYSQSQEESNISFVVDSQGNIVSFPQAGMQGVNLLGHEPVAPANPENPQESISLEEIESAAASFIEDIGYFQTKNLATNAASIMDGRFFIVNIQDLSYSLEKLRYLLIMICLVGALVGDICFLIVYYISKDTEHSVKKILNAMNEANKGNLDSKVEVEGSDEFAKISGHFNVMLAEIKKSEEQERESLLREKNAEIRSLEAQINPHFLYNTLDAINWLAIEEQQFAISQMVTKLAQILRYSIHNSNEIVTVRTELEFLKKYIYLQQQRFDYSFDCTVDLDQRAQDCHIHKLLLQPLVENTIIHGFSGLERDCEIRIVIQYQEEDSLFIEVSDNGVGMSAEQVDTLNNYDYRAGRIETSVGVRNVITRIKLYYGDKGSIRFFSGDSGTTVQIIIPAE